MAIESHHSIINADEAGLLASIKESNDPNQPDDLGRTLLMQAIIYGHSDFVDLILGKGAEVNAAERRVGYTALHFAAEEQMLSAIDSLIGFGAQVDKRDRYGNTPLGKAVSWSKGRGDAICRLLAAGADPNLKNNYGVSPLSLAKQIANFDVLRFFHN